MTDTEKDLKLQDTGLVEMSVFAEIVAMDDDEEEDFAKSLVNSFIEQFEETFEEIKDFFREKNFERLSSLGHYLKGSAAALGLQAISAQCERIQHYGQKDNFDNFLSDKREEYKDEEIFWVDLVEDASEKAKEAFLDSVKALNDYFDGDLIEAHVN